MSKGLVFWVLMLLWLVLGLWTNRAEFKAGNVPAFGGGLILFILLFLLGWATFGPPLQ